jgi:hypothetical protein
MVRLDGIMIVAPRKLPSMRSSIDRASAVEYGPRRMLVS